LSEPKKFKTRRYAVAKRTCGNVYFDCDQLYGDKGWLAWPVIYVEGNFCPAAQWIKPYEDWKALGYKNEEIVLDFGSPDFYKQLEEAFQ